MGGYSLRDVRAASSFLIFLVVGYFPHFFQKTLFWSLSCLWAFFWAFGVKIWEKWKNEKQIREVHCKQMGTDYRETTGNGMRPSNHSGLIVSDKGCTKRCTSIPRISRTQMRIKCAEYKMESAYFSPSVLDKIGDVWIHGRQTPNANKNEKKNLKEIRGEIEAFGTIAHLAQHRGNHLSQFLFLRFERQAKNLSFILFLLFSLPSWVSAAIHPLIFTPPRLTKKGTVVQEQTVVQAPLWMSPPPLICYPPPPTCCTPWMLSPPPPPAVHSGSEVLGLFGQISSSLSSSLSFSSSLSLSLSLSLSVLLILSLSLSLSCVHSPA